MKHALIAALVLLGLSLAIAPSHAAPRPATTATPVPLPSPERLLYDIRRQFRSHRPPPTYVTYTLVRKQTLDDGYPDLLNSYTYHIWCRTTDRAALGRRVYRGSSRGTLEFLRPSFNEPWDPGPPTADLFEAAPAHPHTNPREFVPTPEPTGSLPPTIASVTVMGEFDYRVTRVADEGDEIHVSLQPRRDPDRNRLRELYVDRKTLELKEVIATDKLYDEGSGGRHVYPMLFTVSLTWMNNMPIVTHIHGTPTYQSDSDYLGRDATVDYDFNDITFPASQPDWYFDPRSYAQHVADAPQ
ncbi:MAG TPA: hypothetical protein VHR97_13655 [Candidatus Baltobacteraceae bacterium]|nr:hypothetical protein [Candidatus Baltobacteraceae bacterium]